MEIAVLVTSLAAILSLLPPTLRAKKVLPDYVRVCARSDPEFDACVLRSVEALRPHLAAGIPRMHIPPCDPFQLPALNVSRHEALLTVEAALKDIQLHGGGAFRVLSLRADPAGLTADVTVTLPTVRLSCGYHVAGSLLGVPLQGEGLFHGNLSDVTLSVHARGRLMTSPRYDYVDVTSCKVKVKLGGSAVTFDHSDDLTRGVARTAQEFISQHTSEVIQVIEPVVEDTLQELLLTLAKDIMSRLPLDEILPG